MDLVCASEQLVAVEPPSQQHHSPSTCSHATLHTHAINNTHVKAALLSPALPGRRGGPKDKTRNRGEEAQK
ncbi:hypothetical protein JOB18_008683 [Solea senegalensis]|uniref:Uncharacterized protein n=1 Tax=Solea senegalensis TaxID=28829 RepID=A0AAV6QS49_SOLSE|nr:hypothetical protein JOB18_008683 [Solea senegalensis]